MVRSPLLLERDSWRVEGGDVAVGNGEGVMGDEMLWGCMGTEKR